MTYDKFVGLVVDLEAQLAAELSMEGRRRSGDVLNAAGAFKQAK